MDKIIIDPIRNNPLEYVIASHPRPWKSSFGKIVDMELDDKMLKIHVDLSKEQAVASGRWDRKNNRAVLEIIDQEGIPVFEGWVNFDNKTKGIAKLCVQLIT